jgi:hypothetical protein
VNAARREDVLKVIHLRSTSIYLIDLPSTSAAATGKANLNASTMIAKASSLASLPPFPDDVPTAPIARVSLSKILDGDPDEAASTLEACRTFGFFYLDLRSTSLGDDLLEEAEDLLHLSYKAFDHPIEEKEPYELIKGVSLFGYKYSHSAPSDHSPD